MTKRGSINPSAIEWCTHTVNPKIFDTLQPYENELGKRVKGHGCPNECPYCYGGGLAYRFPQNFPPGFYPDRIYGPKLRDKTIFVESMGDLFREEVTREEVLEVFKRCATLDASNTLVILSKCADRYAEFVDAIPRNAVIGITLETDAYPPGFNPNVSTPQERAEAFAKLKWAGGRLVSIEPIMKFNLKRLLELVLMCRPTWVIIGADSQRCNLPEPTEAEVIALIEALEDRGYTRGQVQDGPWIMLKPNLARLGVEGDCWLIQWQRARRANKILEAQLNGR